MKISVHWFLFSVCIVGIASAIVLIFLLIPNQTTRSLHAAAASPTIVQAPQYVADTTSIKSLHEVAPLAQSRPGIPVRLKIPKLKIDAALESVGRTRQKAMDVPKDLANGAWFNLGPRPGEIGSAVIDGHFGWQDDKQAVFDKLHKLRIGDKIDVVDENAATTTFVVRELRTYAHNQNASNVFESSDGMAHLNLITCQGAWNEEKHSYPYRLVVFAEKVVE